MEEYDTQELFLLEFLVDKVNIPSVQAMYEDVLSVKTCIEFRILNLPPIYICQDAPTSNCVCLGEDAQVFRKGKSCLFALPSRLLEKQLCSFPVCISVYKKLPPTVLPDVMTIGTCQIETRDMINCLIDENISCEENPCKTLKNMFRICTATGQCVGEVGVFIRFSRLGKKVVTQFQNPHNRKPYLFKGKPSSPVFQCRRVPSQTCDDDQLQNCVCEKDVNDCEDDKPKKSCCSAAASSSGRAKSKGSKRGGRGKRSCCSRAGGKDRATSAKLQSQSLGYPSGAQTEQGNRRCGCEIKEDKFACQK